MPSALHMCQTCAIVINIPIGARIFRDGPEFAAIVHYVADRHGSRHSRGQQTGRPRNHKRIGRCGAWFRGKGAIASNVQSKAVLANVSPDPSPKNRSIEKLVFLA